MIIGKKNFHTEAHTYVMGILNVTPDSFSDGGRFSGKDECVRRALEMEKQGADIIDIGGESTRPGYTRITDEEEIYRTAPVIEAIRRETDIPLSIDTYKPAVAECGIKEGADLVNDIWGLKADEHMAEVIAGSNAACCLMHNRENKNYVNMIADVCKDLKESIGIGMKAGIAADRIIVDPGIGFGKNYDDNLRILGELDTFCGMGFPVLLGCSRKSVIGETLGLPVAERLEGTLATTCIAVMNRVAFVRVHDVEANVRTIRMAEAIRDAR